MEIAGEQLIPAPQSAVWKELNEPETLKACIPGCEVIEAVSENEFRIEMMAVVGPVRARFKGTLKIGDVEPPERYVLSFEGSGGAAGFAKGGAQVSLVADDETTRLAYRATAQIGGKLAQVGSRLVDGVAKKMAEEFFARFNARFAAKAPAAAPEEPGIVDATPAGKQGEAPRSRVGWMVAVVALLIVAGWIVYLLPK